MEGNETIFFHVKNKGTNTVLDIFIRKYHIDLSVNTHKLKWKINRQITRKIVSFR